MTTTLTKMLKEPRFAAVSAEESFIQDVQEAFAIVVREQSLSYEDLAKKLRWTPGRVKRFFSHPPPLREIAKIALVLGKAPKFQLL